MNIPAGYAQLNYRFTGIDLPTYAEVTLGVRLVESTPIITVVGLAALNNWVDTVLQEQGSGINLVNVHVKFGPNDTGPSADFPTTEAGQHADAGTFPAASYLIHKVTDTGGRQGRGRMFLPGVTDDVTTPAGLVTNAQLNALGLAFADYVDKMIADDLVPSLLHSDPDVEPYPVVTFIPDSQLATQRRRNRR